MQITLLRHPLTVALSSALLLSACGGSSSNNGGSDQTPVNDPRTVCAFSNTANGVSPLTVIDNSLNQVIIDSITQAAADLRESDPTDPAASQIATKMGFAALIDAFSLFNGIYQCTADMRALNECNWQLPGGEEDETVFVATTIAVDQSYTTEVKRGSNLASATRMLTLEGSIGDAGNLMVTLFEEDGTEISSTRRTTRDINGHEQVEFRSADANYDAEENNDCSGSLSMDYPEFRLEANWTWSGGSTHGTVEYEVYDDDDNGLIELSW